MKRIVNFWNKITRLCIGGLVTTTAAFGYSQSDSVKVLFVGNSYTHMHNMPSIFEKISTSAGQKVIVEKSAKSGASFEEHSTRADLFNAIKKRKWDYVILQGYSRELSHNIERIDTATVPYVRMLRDSILHNNPCTQILFYMTWGYDDGYHEREEVNSFEKMADSIARGYQYLGNFFNVPVVPVGMVWKQVRNNTNIDLYVEDRAHPSKNGSFLIASTFYNAIFNTSLDKVFTNTILGEDAKQIKQHMQNYMLDHRTKFNLDKIQFYILDQSAGSSYYISYLSSFADSMKLTWDFGDKTITKAAGGIHVYEKPGKYEIVLKVEDDCGNVRSFRKWIEIKPVKIIQAKK